jgi:beta-galactosidase
MRKAGSLGLVVLALALMGPCGPPPSRIGGASGPRVDETLAGGWRFIRTDVPGAQAADFDDTSWTAVTLPHTWNAADGQDGGNNYHRGAGWYRRPLALPAAFAGRRVYLQFDAASMVADVWVNGTHVGQHRGGFAAFRFDVTSLVHPGGSDVVAVKVSNQGAADLPPLQGDFTLFGGLYRDVHVIAVDPVHVDLDDLGSSGVVVTTTDVSAARARVGVRVLLANAVADSRDVDVTVAVADGVGRQIATGTRRASLAAAARGAASIDLDIAAPRLWNGRADPHLYTAAVTLAVAGKVVDRVRQPFGIRSFALDPAVGFSLNGAPLDLHGVNRHQDRIDKGWAIARADHDQDLALILEVGATAVRLAHYQHAQYFYDLCDRAGLVVWTELALVDRITESPEFTANARQQLTELIRQGRNHPSIVFWGLGNEVVDGPENPNPLLGELQALARAEDPSRLTTFASNRDDASAINWHTDSVAFNKYYGWYYGDTSQLAAWADGLHAARPRAAVGISEYGAGASAQLHSDSHPPVPVPEGQHFEEYQAHFHEVSWQALAARPFIWGKFVWTMFDFASDWRAEGDLLGRNDKGLVTYDRVTKKDAFYFYKASWSAEPVVHIASRRFTPRTAATTTVKVYSNAATVTLSLNGASLGPVTAANHVFVWGGVTLARGTNHVTAEASFGSTKVSDAVDWVLPSQ